jgi:hypothetical protein
MPELVDIREAMSSMSEQNKQVFQPKFDLLHQLEDQYRQALTTPSMSEIIRTSILERIITDGVKDIVHPILRKIFVSLPEDYRGHDVTPQDIGHILNCILTKFTDDLPLFGFIPMLIRMHLKSFYNESPFRIALASSFVASSGYTAWISGMNRIANLGTSTCASILSVMAHCAHLAYSPTQYMAEYTRLLGETVVQDLGDTIDFLLPSAGGTFAMSNIFLLGKIYGPARFVPAKELLEAHNARRAHLPPMNIAPGAAVPGAAAPFIGPQPQDSILMRMYTELMAQAATIGNLAKNHLCRLIDIIRAIRHTPVGIVGRIDQRMSHKANVCAVAWIYSFMDTIDNQAREAGLDRDVLYAKNLLDAIFPSVIREGTETAAKEEIILTAHRIKSGVIDCLKLIPGFDISKLEKACVVFRSDLTQDMVNTATRRELSYILEMLLLASREVQFGDSQAGDSQAGDSQAGDSQAADSQAAYSQMSESSTTALPPMTPAPVRLNDISRLFLERLESDPGMFRTPEEQESLQKMLSHISYFGMAFKLFDKTGLLLKKMAHSKVVQCLSSETTGLASEMYRKLSKPSSGSAALRFRPDLFPFIPSLQRLLTGPWIPVLNEIRTSYHNGKSYTDIVRDVCTKYSFTDHKKFHSYIRMLLTRLKLETLWNVEPGSFQHVIRTLLNEEGETVERGDLTVNINTTNLQITNSGYFKVLEILPVELFEKDVILPSVVTDALQGLRTTANNLKNRLTDSLWSSAVSCKPVTEINLPVVAEINSALALAEPNAPAAALMPFNEVQINIATEVMNGIIDTELVQQAAEQQSERKHETVVAMEVGSDEPLPSSQDSIQRRSRSRSRSPTSPTSPTSQGRKKERTRRSRAMKRKSSRSRSRSRSSNEFIGGKTRRRRNKKRNNNTRGRKN